MSITHIPFYPSDWLAGTRGMTAEETGVYITLISRMYEMAGPIERDDERLYRLCGCKSKRAFTKVLEYLFSEGKVQEQDGGLFNVRVQKEIKVVTEKSSKARAAATSRWERKPNKNNETGNANASPEHMPQQCQPKPKPNIEDTNVSLSSSDDAKKAFEIFKAAAEESGWPVPSMFSPDRKKKLLARLKDVGGLSGWEVAIEKAQASRHMCGDNSRGWVCNFDFFLQPSSLAKLMEGNYDNRDNTSQTAPGNFNGQSKPGRGTSEAFASTAAKLHREQGRGGEDYSDTLPGF